MKMHKILRAKQTFNRCVSSEWLAAKRYWAPVQNSGAAHFKQNP
jgi:hypothetical protein